jgi:serine kinase of HPr protein (carbohydrate metabolism regulator)
MTNVCIDYQHGPYVFKLSTEKIADEIFNQKLMNAILLQFNSFLPIEKQNAAIEFYFVEDVNVYFQHEVFTNIGSVQYAGESIKFSNSEITFVYTKNNTIHKVYIKVVDNTNLKANMRLLNKSYTNVIENQVAVFYYRIFLIFTQLVNIEHDTTYIHGASICNSSKEALLFPADSGVGKSSMLLRLAKEKKYAYIADDLSIIDNKLNTYYSGRAISVKPYHIKNFPFLASLMEAEMPKYQQIQWKILKDNRLVFGLCPQALFKGHIAKQARIKQVVHLINTNEKNFSIKQVDAKTLASASANILMNELFLGYYNIYKALAIPGNTLFLSPGQMYQKTFEHYEKLFGSTENYLLTVPYMSHPNDMYEFLVTQNILD